MKIPVNRGYNVRQTFFFTLLPGIAAAAARPLGTYAALGVGILAIPPVFWLEKRLTLVDYPRSVMHVAIVLVAMLTVAALFAFGTRIGLTMTGLIGFALVYVPVLLLIQSKSRPVPPFQDS